MIKRYSYFYSFVLFFTVACLFFSCKDMPTKEATNETTKVYTGDFSGSPIDLTITMLNDSSVKGVSSHLGVEREMSGKRSGSDKGYVFKLKELGTGSYIGVFDFELDTSLNIIFGSWQLSDSTGNREAVLYTLMPKN